ncbi:SGNH hydrolase [Parathielavia appendiculata]|uniref:SGNH hydrolase n=1 Tax=Parathielavia appendiculata TaxID=2587402 RepID=A0AAN6TPT5_9PEZI|nr:SGNH hydrolase [Parathielavia appendiculata]
MGKLRYVGKCALGSDSHELHVHKDGFSTRSRSARSQLGLGVSSFIPNMWCFTMRASAILLSLLLPIALSQVIEGGWTAFGDSYAAGIGAGSKHASDTGDCRRRVNAYPNQIQTDGSLAGGSNVQFSFQACSSAKIAEVQSQITKFRDGPEQLRGFATISIGGNDAGFSEVIEACLVRAKFGSPSCDSVIEAKTERVKSTDMRQNLEDAYRAILDAAKAPGKLITSFRLVVTGYARFFNEETTDCNNRHISFWGLLEPNKQYLTVERRKALNKLVSDMNEVVKAAAEKVSRESEFGQVVFVPIDELFEGHRFCEPDVKEPDNKNPNSWFFLLQGRDAAPDGSLLPPSYPDEPVNLTPSECEALLNGTTPPLGDGWGEFMLCSAQQGTAEGKQLADWITDDTDGNLSGGINIPEAWGKAFHPKSIGHARIRQAIINRLNSRGANHKRVVIMHDGTLEEFEAMINHPLNSRLDAQRIEQPGINIRGYAVWIEADAARKIRDTVTGVVGVLFERADELPPAWPVVPWTTQDAAGVANATERRDGTLQKRIPSPATTTDLDFERHLYPLGDNVDIWHLGVLSQPPALPDLRLLDFRRGYLHDPKGGSGVNIYVLDSGANLDHHEISSRLRTDGLPSYVTRASKLGVIDDASGHGTCMASLIGGKKYGVTKTGNNIIPVRWELGSQTGSPKGASLFEGLLWILFDVKQHNKQGKAVLNYSGGEFTTYLT